MKNNNDSQDNLYSKFMLGFGIGVSIVFISINIALGIITISEFIQK